MAADEVAVVPVGLFADDAVVPLEAADRPVGPSLELAAEMGEHLKRADRLGASRMPAVASVGHQRGIEAKLQVRRADFFVHPQDIVVILDERLVILEGQRHARVSGVAGTLDQGLAAPTPDFLIREFFVDDRPVALGDVVGGELGMAGHAPPGQEHSQVGAPRSAVMRISSRI